MEAAAANSCDIWFRVWVLGFGYMVEGLGVGFWGLGFGV
jgi:hypothetical protein